jgi:transposase
MSIKETERLKVLLQLQQKIFSQKQAAEMLGLTTRHVRRLLHRYEQHGAAALGSKKRDKPSNHQLPKEIKEYVLAIIKERYSDFGPTLAHEKIREQHKVRISLRSVRRLMIVNGLWTENKVKKRRVYQLRERRSQEGELVQKDGSPHDWFEGRGPICCLIHCVDDATGKILAALFAPSECLWGYYDLMRIYFKTHGKPKVFYNDKHGVFKVNKKEALSGNGLTQFGRAMKELGIGVIFANTPQAKGRIERSNRTLQDRLVKELRLRNISTIEEANKYLPSFIEGYNKRFAVVPKNPSNAHTPLLDTENLDLILTKKDERHLSKNLTFQYNNVIYQIQTERETYALKKAKVIVRESRDGSIKVYYKNKELVYTTYRYQEKQGQVVDSKTLNTVVDELLESASKKRAPYKPSLDHPWRGGRKRSSIFSPAW